MKTISTVDGVAKEEEENIHKSIFVFAFVVKIPSTMPKSFNFNGDGRQSFLLLTHKVRERKSNNHERREI